MSELQASGNRTIEMVCAEYEAMNRQDWPRVFSEAQPDFEFKPPGDGVGASPSLGPDKARDDTRSFFEPYEEVIIEPLEFHERGDRLVVYFRLRTRPHGSSAMVEIRAGHLWTIRDGKLAGLQIFPEREKALEAAESPPG